MYVDLTEETSTTLTFQGKDVPVACLQYLFRQCEYNYTNKLMCNFLELYIFSSNLTSPPGKLTFWQIQLLVVITVIFVVIEVGLWMAMGVVVSHVYPNGSK